MNNLKLTPIGEQGQVYKTTFAPHYLVRIASIDGDTAHCWAYNAWGRLFESDHKVSELEEYEVPVIGAQ